MAENLILFKTDDGQIKLDGETVWLTRAQMASLFERGIKTIGKHINNALNEELSSSAVAKFATTAADGKTRRRFRFSSSSCRKSDERV